MTNDEIINQIIQQMPLASVSINICDAATRAAKAALSYKDNQPISELGGWQTEQPTKDCTVLLYITEQTLTVSRWNSPNKMFYDEYLEPIKHWLKWKLI